MLLLTGATGLIGGALLRRLTSAGTPVRCLVRDPRQLRTQRVQVQLALGDLADPPSFRNALRGVSTVVHLAVSLRDQREGSIEELSAIATWRLVQAAERAGVQRFVFTSMLGASSHSRSRVLRAKALAEEAVTGSSLDHVVLAPSFVYDRGDRRGALLHALAHLPVVPVSGRGGARFAPIWAHDVADALVAVLDGGGDGRSRYELAGPDVLTQPELVRALLRGTGSDRPLLPVPVAAAAAVLRAGEALLQSRTPVTWDEAELLEVSMLAADGTADARALGVSPHRIADVLGDPRAVA